MPRSSRLWRRRARARSFAHELHRFGQAGRTEALPAAVLANAALARRRCWSARRLRHRDFIFIDLGRYGFALATQLLLTPHILDGIIDPSEQTIEHGHGSSDEKRRRSNDERLLDRSALSG